MACGGFTCSKNALAALNVLYILVAFILIGVATYGKAVAIITSIAIMGGIIACGVFLLIISMVGLVGAVKHHQVMLFFYMIILFLLFLIQFAIACACLAVNKDQQNQLAKTGWESARTETRDQVQQLFKCCGFTDQSPSGNHPSCHKLECCTSPSQSTASCCSEISAVSGNSTTTTTAPSTDSCPCGTCEEQIAKHMDSALKVAGGIGLFFSFTEIIGVWLAVRYRNQKDPRANPSAFL